MSSPENGQNNHGCIVVLTQSFSQCMIAQNDPDEKLVSTQDISLKKCYYYIMFRNIVFKKYKAKSDLA